MNEIRFFIGTDANGGCAECNMVLEYSIKKHCSVPYTITRMAISDDPESYWHGWNTSTWSTPFSGFRYGIAEYCNFEGHAIYCDDDQLFLQDPVNLWNIKDGMNQNDWLTGKKLLSGEIRHCVSVINCEAWKDNKVISPTTVTNDKIMAKQYPGFVDYMKATTIPLVTKIMDGKWNNFDGEDQKLEDIGLLHLTDMSTNPGVHMAIKRLGDQSKHWYDGPLRQHPREDVITKFQQYYNEALNSGMRVEDYLPEKMINYNKQSQRDYKANNGWSSV